MKTAKPYLLFLLAILLLISIPKQTSGQVRGVVAATLAPVWKTMIQIKETIYNLFGYGAKQRMAELKIQRLELENHQQAMEMDRLRQLLIQKQLLSRELSALENSQELSEAKELHREQRKEALLYQFHGLPARVIFRSSSSWSSSLWVDVGFADNKDRQIVAINSPVVLGKSVVGVLDYVGEHQSRVRLITDSVLSPSVRALRGGEQATAILSHLKSLLDRISLFSEVSLNLIEKEQYRESLRQLEAFLTMQEKTPSFYLAKGELHGSSQPIWRSLGNRLKGVGFNYDFSDEEGPSRDLRTGRIAFGDSEKNALPILKVGDLLVTTGMDGVFPPGLHVAEVTNINLLREGDFYYELEAEPTAGNLNELSLLFILPPISVQ